MTGVEISKGINVQKAIDIMLSLIVSPLVGLLVAGGLLLLLKNILRPRRSTKHLKSVRHGTAKKRPPFWTRFTLIASAMGVSFVHGSNDGQKGIGMIMLVLIGIVPGQFVLNMESTSYQIGRTKDAALHMGDFYQRNSVYLDQMIDLKKSTECRDASGI